mgnify:CR=1 FL=1
MEFTWAMGFCLALLGTVVVLFVWEKIPADGRSERPYVKRLHPTDRPKRPPKTGTGTRQVDRSRGERSSTKEKPDQKPRTKRPVRRAG